MSSCKKKENNTNTVPSKDSAEKRFEGEFFSFNYPEDWEITDNEEIEKGVYYLSVEKTGFDSSGLMTIVSFNEMIDLDDLVLMNIEELQNNPVIMNLKFESISNNVFNNIESRASNFKFSTLGLKHEGLISAFQGTKNSYVILKQEALEDTIKNANGFSTIERSFETK
ncbi:hypothetical protein [uncultured Psychroserpens sp.]|uniref:hypothetical protein n=1 Tax=uncultured Psychroserpens sp. TaxID=255436 RepID=UPI00260A3EEC|nr:hypothetical protein [uncultured Psychroserpens sp.]